ncbi:unnamed protein product [Didymodactylos carnosus]|uniref:Uncharacterized protein n=1 Tax=Didymodactylos carnosus TaxID=1234261 RepID=A0A813THM8_9BILA|nr:unnamed protein product [Didymodactylos carnosus]CAF1270238.1 unnamed protein product [Didymodactylos carnosus]CAF3597542.1 unnamed protein product [Didymodactylos carnosus]CAF4075838.1 unnamed protein product [Didymodactylos carnosus]
MTNNNDDLDDFFKKKDKKTKKSTKSQLLTNNEELLKQLVAVTTHEQQDYDDDDMDLPAINEEFVGNHSLPLFTVEDDRTVIVNPQPFVPVKGTNLQSKKKTSANQSATAAPTSDSKASTASNQDDEWEEFPEHGDPNAWIVDQDEDEYLYADENDGEPRRDQKELQQKPAWNQLVNNNDNDQQQQQQQQHEQETKISLANIVESGAKQQVGPTATQGKYVAPHQRGGGSISSVEKPHRKPSSKVQPNFQSTEEFPVLGTAMTNMKINEKK